MSDRNPPAFPRSEPHDEGFSEIYPGMTLADYFAGQALCGLLASPNCRSTFNERTIAHMAFEVADAMLAARQA